MFEERIEVLLQPKYYKDMSANKSMSGYKQFEHRNLLSLTIQSINEDAIKLDDTDDIILKNETNVSNVSTLGIIHKTKYNGKDFVLQIRDGTHSINAYLYNVQDPATLRSCTYVPYVYNIFYIPYVRFFYYTDYIIKYI